MTPTATPSPVVLTDAQKGRIVADALSSYLRDHSSNLRDEHVAVLQEAIAASQAAGHFDAPPLDPNAPPVVLSRNFVKRPSEIDRLDPNNFAAHVGGAEMTTGRIVAAAPVPPADAAVIAADEAEIAADEAEISHVRSRRR